MTTIKLLRDTTGRSYLRLGLAVAAALILAGSGSGRLDVMAQSNPITVENGQTGDPGWDIAGTAGDPTIQGFATNISVNKGETVTFKVNTPSTNYTIDIYRLGYYGGLGARKVATVLLDLFRTGRERPGGIARQAVGAGVGTRAPRIGGPPMLRHSHSRGRDAEA